MSMEQITPERVLEPLRTSGWRYYASVAVTGGVTLLALYAWFVMLTRGMEVTGLRNWGTQAGVSWGIFTGMMIWWVGIAHGGIAVSAGARLLKKDRYKPIARISELLTVFSLAMVGLLITWHLARPDRIFNTITNWPATVAHSPLTWDVTVVLLYLVLSLTYLLLTLRDDLYVLRDRLPEQLQPVYALLTIGYDPTEREKVEQMAWWLALAILLLVPLLSGGVVPWIFQLMGSQPGWFGAVIGPSMVTGAIAAALGMVLVIAYVVRRAFTWDDIIDDSIFAGLATVDAVFVLGYLYFVLQERLTGGFAALEHESHINQALLTGQLAPYFWTAIALLVAGFAYFVYQYFTGEVSAFASAGAGLAVAIAIFIEKARYVIAGLLYPGLLYADGSYAPTWVEWTLVFSTFAMTILGYLVVMKIIPLVELPAHADTATVDARGAQSTGADAGDTDVPGVHTDDVDTAVADSTAADTEVNDD